MVKICQQAIKYILLLLLLVYVLFPFMWMLSTAIKPDEEIMAFTPSLITFSPTLRRFPQIWNEGHFNRFFINSVVVSGMTTIITLVTTVPAGYVLSRLSFNKNRAARYLTNSIQMVPVFLLFIPLTVLVIPLFLTMRTMGLINTRSSLILSYVTQTFPLSIWMLKAFFEKIPSEIDDAAMIDGCSQIGALFRVILPLNLAGVAVTGVFAFILAWREFLFASAFTSRLSAQTVPIGISLFIGAHIVNYGSLMAASALGSIPILIIFMCIQRFVIEGLSAGALKG